MVIISVLWSRRPFPFFLLMGHYYNSSRASFSHVMYAINGKRYADICDARYYLRSEVKGSLD